MNKKNGFAVALMFGAGIVYRPSAAYESPVQKTVANAKAAAAQTAARTKQGPWLPFCEHMAVDPLPDPTADSIHFAFSEHNGSKTAKAELKVLTNTSDEADSTDKNAWLSCTPREPVKFIIASVPDPEQTHLALDFDRYVESIAWAVGDSDYSLESYWFPWQIPADKEETDPEKRAAAWQDRQRRLNRPGLILFRKIAAGTPGLLAVLVVGERPTFGVNRVAFHSSFNAIHLLAPKDKKFYVLGPSFSGSLQPLTRLLEEAESWEPAGKKQFFVVSGQVTSDKDITRFGNDSSTLCTTLHNDKYALHYFARFIDGLNHEDTFLVHRIWSWVSRRNSQDADIALLSEDETAYGSSFSDSKSILMLRYPRGIARLRNSTEELPNIGASNGNSSHSQFPEIPLILKESGEDVIRNFSQQQMPVSSEAVLLNIAAMLRRQKIHYVAVTATDPLDALFLSRFLRSACPNVELVIFSSDLLFARMAHDWSLEGLLAVTTYPLFLQNQAYMGAPLESPRRIPFASAYAQGLYNATRRILLDFESPQNCDVSLDRAVDNDGATDQMLEYSSPFPDQRAPGEGKERLPVRGHSPKLWLTILGHDSFWPLALLDGQPDPGIGPSVFNGPQPTNETQGFRPENPSLVWVVVFALTALHSWITVFAIAVMNLKWPGSLERRLRGFDFIRNFSIHPCNNCGAARAANLIVILITIAIVNGLFVIQFYFQKSPWFGYPCLAAMSIALLEAVVITIWRREIFRNWETSCLTLFSYGFGLCCALLLYLMLQDSKGFHTNDFFAYRTLHPESGVSPTLPILIIAIGYHYWAFVQLRRLRWIQERKPSIPEHPCICVADGSGPHLAVDVKPRLIEPPNLLQNEIESIFSNRTSFLSIALTVFWLILFWPMSHVKSAERDSYQLLFGILLIVMYGMLIGNWVRFMFLWRDLGQVLHFLESHPLREAFSRLPRQFSWTSIWMGSLRPGLITITRSYDCLQRLSHEGVPLLSAQRLQEVRVGLQEITDEQRTGIDRYGDQFFTAFNNVEKRYGCAAREATNRLEGYWANGVSDTVAAHEERVAPAALKRGVERQWLLEEFLALRYVAFIRYIQQQMRNFLEFVTTAFILLAIATVAYPFQGHRSIATAHLLLFLVLGTGVGIVFARMDRDPLLSRLNDTKPNELGLDFLWRVVSYGSLPLLTLLGSQFPSIRDFLLSWVQPALQAVK